MHFAVDTYQSGLFIPEPQPRHSPSVRGVHHRLLDVDRTALRQRPLRMCSGIVAMYGPRYGGAKNGFSRPG